MTVKRDPDAILATWLEDGPSRLPHATRRAIAVGTRTTTQRRHGLAVLWRSLGMNPFARTGLAVIAVVLAIGGAALILNPPQPSLGAGVPSASPTRVATSSPTGASTPPAQSGPAASPISFTSSRYLYTLRYPSDYIVEPASTDWPIG